MESSLVGAYLKSLIEAPLALHAKHKWKSETVGIEAITHHRDGTPVTIPRTPKDWDQWVSAGRTRNWIMNDPLLDWLQLYGKSRDYIP